jgi:hypothetical protein
LSRCPQRFLWIGGIQDRIQNAIQILVDLRVEKPNDSNALFVKLDLTIQVVRLGKVASMAGTIQLDGEVGFGAKEIDDSLSDWNLPAKFQSTQFSISQMRPKLPFMPGRNSS